MRGSAKIAVVIPALNEAQSIGRVLRDVPSWVDDVIVADNGSTDATAQVARDHGARVVREPQRGYGAACLAGIAALQDPDVVVFLDGDYSDHPDEMPDLVDPIVAGEADLVIGSRALGRREPGALTPQARFGNWLACALIRLIWRVQHTDLGPFRAIRTTALHDLHMQDRDYGWTVEMQVKAAARPGIRAIEAPASYRRRIGRSKISGTIRGVLGAGTKILATILLAALDARRAAGGPGARERLVVFTRHPTPGRTKTRLIPALGREGAAELQRQMTERTTAQARIARRRRGTEVQVRFAGGSEGLVRGWLGQDLPCQSQGEGDLGERMARAFRQAQQAGLERTVIVGTDCPGLTARVMARAFDALRHSDVVLGPATDGGYYLIGLRRPAADLFAGMSWGTEYVLQQSLQKAKRAGLTTALLEPLDDVDRPEDIQVWRRATAQAGAARLSVIVPALNEAGSIATAVASAAAAPGAQIVVADGGSTDDTVAAARRLGARVVHSSPGRAAQMNAGAAAASGDVLLFLHADTVLPAGYHEHVCRAMAQPTTVAGAFEVRLDSPSSAALRLIEWGMNWRSRHAGLPYGDQALFVRAGAFRQVGGFPDLPIMEDVELVRRLRRLGRIALVSEPVTTSARRWERLGAVRTTLLNQVVIAAFYLGVDPQRIAAWYRREGARDRTG